MNGRNPAVCEKELDDISIFQFQCQVKVMSGEEMENHGIEVYIIGDDRNPYPCRKDRRNNWKGCYIQRPSELSCEHYASLLNDNFTKLKVLFSDSCNNYQFWVHHHLRQGYEEP